MSEKEKRCKDLVGEHYRNRMTDLRAMMKAENDGNEAGPEDTGPLNEYGLCFDYVSPETFNGQRHGYFRYQISWGGPSDEFRYYLDESFRPTRVEYWYMDWFDGAKRTVSHGKDFEFLSDLFEYLTGGDAGEMIKRSA